MSTYVTPAHDPRCREQLGSAVTTLYRRASIISGHQLSDTPEHTTSWLYEQLTEAGENFASMASYMIAKELIDGRDLDDPRWWGTPLGRTVVWFVGWPASPHDVRIVPATVTGAVLGISRQRVHQLTWRPGPIWSDGLRTRLREDWPAVQARDTRRPRLRVVEAS